MPELTITNAGRQAAIDANNNGLTVRMAKIAVGTGQYTPVTTQTTLQTQVAVADIARGLAIGTDQVQVSARFTDGAWEAYELGVFLDDGTLFAIGSSNTAGDFPTKEAGTDVVVTVTLLISDVPSGSVTVEATIQTTIPKATTTESGTVELADDSDPETDDERAVTPALLKTRVDAIVTRLAGTAPAALDTITEISAALQNNPSVITDLLSALSERVREDALLATIDRLLGSEDWRMGFDVVDGLLLLSKQLAVKQTAAVSLTQLRTEHSTITRLQAARALQTGGYAGADINAALNTVYSQTATEYVGVLATAGYTVSYTATALLAAYPTLTASEMATALLAAYPTLTASEIAEALVDRYSTLTASQMVSILLAGYSTLTASQLANGLHAGYTTLTDAELGSHIVGTALGWTGASDDLRYNDFIVPSVNPDDDSDVIYIGWSELPSSAVGHVVLNETLPIHSVGSFLPRPRDGVQLTITTEQGTFLEDTSSLEGSTFIREFAIWKRPS